MRSFFKSLKNLFFRQSPPQPTVNDGWYDDALFVVERYLHKSANDTETFNCEQVRTWAQKQGLLQPADTRVWGSVMRRAARKGLITRVGTGKSANSSRHGGYVTKWKKANTN